MTRLSAGSCPQVNGFGTGGRRVCGEVVGPWPVVGTRSVACPDRLTRPPGMGSSRVRRVRAMTSSSSTRDLPVIAVQLLRQAEVLVDGSAGPLCRLDSAGLFFTSSNDGGGVTSSACRAPRYGLFDFEGAVVNHAPTNERAARPTKAMPCFVWCRALPVACPGKNVGRASAVLVK